jgi:hypothetical protein
VHKEKIPSHLSFALKTSMLEMALQEVGLECPVDLHYRQPESTGVLLEARYRPPREGCSEPHLYVGAGTVPSQSRQDMATLLKETVLLDFMVWLDELRSLPANSPILWKEPVFHAAIRGGRVHLSHDFIR